jgi:hypothetical protein
MFFSNISDGMFYVYSTLPSLPGCVHGDSLFVGSGDYRLQGTSPCIDAGSNDLLPADIATDVEGNWRILDGDGDEIATVDMGAYEKQ